MANTTSKSEKNLEILKVTVSTVNNLITQLRSAVQPNLDNVSSKEEEQTSRGAKSEINALDLAHDAASLLKAHSTKISLLIINKPFTATAINTVLREVSAGPLPSLASAVELCDGSLYTEAMAKELRWMVEKVLAEFAAFLNEIPLNGEILSVDQKNGSGGTVGKGSLASTGVVWQACEQVMALKSMGIAGLVIQKALQYRDTIKDALEELQEWGEEEDSEDEDDEQYDNGHSEDEDDLSDPAQQAIDDMFGNQRHIPKDDTNKIRQRLESSLKRLRLIALMFEAVVKRRFKTLPILPLIEPNAEPKPKQDGTPRVVQTLDEVLNVMKKLPDITDELANGFYELDTTEIDKQMDDLFFTGFAATELLVKNWQGEKDEFTAWAQKFQTAMKKGW